MDSLFSPNYSGAAAKLRKVIESEGTGIQIRAYDAASEVKSMACLLGGFAIGAAVNVLLSVFAFNHGIGESLANMYGIAYSNFREGMLKTANEIIFLFNNLGMLAVTKALMNAVSDCTKIAWEIRKEEA